MLVICPNIVAPILFPSRIYFGIATQRPNSWHVPFEMPTGAQFTLIHTGAFLKPNRDRAVSMSRAKGSPVFPASRPSENGLKGDKTEFGESLGPLNSSGRRAYRFFRACLLTPKLIVDHNVLIKMSPLQMILAKKFVEL